MSPVSLRDAHPALKLLSFGRLCLLGVSAENYHRVAPTWLMHNLKLGISNSFPLGNDPRPYIILPNDPVSGGLHAHHAGSALCLRSPPQRVLLELHEDCLFTATG